MTKGSRDRRRGNGALVIVGFLMMLAVLPAYSQSEEPVASKGTETLTIEDRYLSAETTTSAATLDAQLRTTDEELKMLALENMETQFEAGVLPRDSETAFNALAYVLEEGVVHVTKGDSMPLHYFPDVRREAARIISMSTHDGVVPQLLINVMHDPEATVRAQALYSLGNIGEDPDQQVSEAIAKRLLREHLGEPDYGVVYAALLATESIYSDPDNEPHGAVREMVMQVSTGPYRRVIREKAMKILGTM